MMWAGYNIIRVVDCMHCPLHHSMHMFTPAVKLLFFGKKTMHEKWFFFGKKPSEN